jgi:hypothetical protein
VKPQLSPLWKRANVHAWCVAPFDAMKRTPEARAKMLADLGFESFAYDWREADTELFEAEIVALSKRGINLLAWMWPWEADDPLTGATLELFRVHRVSPQLWSFGSTSYFPKTPEEWAPYLPADFRLPSPDDDWDSFSSSDKEVISRAAGKVQAESILKSADQQREWVKLEADRIAELVNAAGPYGCRVVLYNHNGWFGIMDNQLAVIHELEARGIDRDQIGIAYNFSHARDDVHDDSAGFAELWSRIAPYVVAVNITGKPAFDEPAHDGPRYTVYPSQGDCELEMMRTIQESGWLGPIGVTGENGLVPGHGQDVAITLRNALAGLDWLAMELSGAGVGGPRPLLPDLV